MSQPHVVAVIQARMGSERLPGKVLADIAGRPMLQRVIDRVQQSRSIDQVVVATTDRPDDLALVECCGRLQRPVIAGSVQDVLSRYLLAAESFSADVVVRITADCPLIDPSLIDDVVGKLLGDSSLDYACNFFPHRRFPRGLDVEALWTRTLRRLADQPLEPRHREHVTLYLYEHPESHGIGTVTTSIDASRWRWTVDYLEDLDVAAALYRHFRHDRFSWLECLELCEQQPEWTTFNQHLSQKAA